MKKGLIFFLSALLCTGLFSKSHSQGVSDVQVVIDGYTRSTTLTSGRQVLLGTQLILVCHVVGLPYGTPLSYTWTCPNGPCEVEGYYGRKIYNEHILAVNTTSTSDGGTYTCQVTATGRQETNGSFTLRVTGGRVVHSYGRLIPHEFPITDLQQISGPDGIRRITCTVSSRRARFNRGGLLENRGVTQTRNGATATLVVNPTNVASFTNRDVNCNNDNYYFYLFLSSISPLRVPTLTVNTFSTDGMYRVERDDTATTRVITGFNMFRFGVPMIGGYVNARNRVTISPTVPGTQYRITAWALDSTRRSETPAVESVTTREARPSAPRILSITRILEAGIELNWLPPTEPNGEVHYVIYYTPEGGTEQSNDTGRNMTHYNLTGLERNRVYTNIIVQAVNSVGRSDRRAVIAQYNHTPPVPTPPMEVNITRVFESGVELNWLPPTEPNGEVHYVIYYTPENDTERSIDTGRDQTQHILTGLERNRVYTNISVQAVNSVGRSDRSAVIAQYNHTPSDPTVTVPLSNQLSTDNTVPIVAGVVASAFVVLVLLVVVVLVVIVVRRMRTRKEVEQLHYQPEQTPNEEKHPSSANTYGMYDMPELQHHLSADVSGHYELDEAFTGTASAIAAHSINTYDGVQYSEVDQGSAGNCGRGGYEVAGMYEEPVSNSVVVTVIGMQKSKKKMAGTTQKESASKAVNLDELYAQPDKSKKKTKEKEADKDEGLNTTRAPDQLYAQPDKSKKSVKKQGKQQQLQSVTDPEQLYTQPNKARAADVHTVGEDTEVAPQLPPPYVPDEEQYYNTRSGAGPPNQEGMYAYAVIDWQQK